MINYWLITHPHLFAGVDDCAWALDEINGGGLNDPSWPDTFTGTAVTKPLVIGLEEINNIKIDYCVRAEDREFIVPPQQAVFCVRG